MLKKKLLKKIAASFILGGVIIGGFATNGFAINNEDHYWQLYQVLGDSGNHYINELRYKMDTSPVYVQITGTKNQPAGDYVDMFVVDRNHNSLQYGIAAKRAYGKGQYSIHSYAYEKKGAYSPITVGFYAPYHAVTSWTAYGNWSPDSLGRYS